MIDDRNKRPRWSERKPWSAFCQGIQKPLHGNFVTVNDVLAIMHLLSINKPCLLPFRVIIPINTPGLTFEWYLTSFLGWVCSGTNLYMQVRLCVHGVRVVEREGEKVKMSVLVGRWPMWLSVNACLRVRKRCGECLMRSWVDADTAHIQTHTYHQPFGGGPAGIDHRHFSDSAQNQRERGAIGPIFRLVNSPSPRLNLNWTQKKKKKNANEVEFFFLIMSSKITQYSTKCLKCHRPAICWSHLYSYMYRKRVAPRHKMVTAIWTLSVWSSW